MKVAARSAGRKCSPGRLGVEQGLGIPGHLDWMSTVLHRRITFVMVAG